VSHMFLLGATSGGRSRGTEAGDYRTRSAPRSSKDARRHARLEIACSIDIKPADDDIIEDS